MFARSAALAGLTRVSRRWPKFRPATSTAFRLSNGYQHATAPVIVTGAISTGSRIVLDLRDQAQRHINIWGTVEDRETEIVRGLARPGWCVLDVGANAGYFALTCADLGGPSSDVHAFEPQPALAIMLAESVRINRSPVSVVHAACGSTDGEIEILLSDDPNWSALATVIPGHYSVATIPVRVPLIQLDRYCTEQGLSPDFIKIDVEGYEAAVVAGLTKTLKSTGPPVLCEVSFGLHDEPPVFDLFHDLGYSWEPVSSDPPVKYRDAGRTIRRWQSDMLFIRDG